VAYKKRFANRPRITIDEVDNFKEEFLQSALDEAWEDGMREAAGIVANGSFLHDQAPDALFAKAVSKAILTRIKERKK